MAATRSDRPPSISSSVTEAEVFDDEKHGAAGSSDGSFVKLKTPDEIEAGDDVERAELLPGGQEKAPQPKAENSTKAAAAWMVVNTLATIGIVSFANLCRLRGIPADPMTPGLHEQGNLFRPVTEVGATHLRSLSFLHNMAYALYPLPASICDVRPKEGCNQRDYSLGNCHVSQCHPPESLAGVLDRHILPSSTNPTDTHGCVDELCPVQGHPPKNGHICFGSSLPRRWNGLIL
jgi:hypothetical protein